MFKVKNNIAPEIMHNIFSFKQYHTILETARLVIAEMLIQFSMDQKLYPP